LKPKTVKTYTVDEAKRKLEHYCAYQDRSHYQVEKKLREMRMIPEAIDDIVLHLMKENFLNEERFARSYVRGKFRIKQWGKQKIVQGLKQQYIHQNLINKALEEIDSEEYLTTIKTLIVKKKREYRTKSAYELRQKISRYLYQKGYRFDEFSDWLE
jgi:regulatory protein